MADSRDSELIDGASLAVEVSLSDPSPELVQSPESPDGFVHVESSRDGIDGDLGGSDNQESRGLGGDDDDLTVTEDAGKEEMFVDCPDELVGNLDIKEAFVAPETEESFEENIHFQVENRGQAGLLATENVERETFSRELSGLRNELRALVNRDEPLGESGYGRAVISECSEMVKSALEERLRNEAMIKELEAVVLAKNKEIEELNGKVSGFAVSDIETVTDRLLAYYSGVVDPQELVDYSIAGKLVFVERGTYMLAERYNMMLYEIDMLRQSFSEAGSDFGSQDLATFLGSARGVVLDFGRKESEFGEKIRQFEDENKKLVQQLNDLTSELGKTKTELEQETTRCGNFREKLTMAVTKGKALVQQRDSLKSSLAEKAGELEKLALESAEKSKALEAAELTESLVASLQETLVQKNAALEKFEEMMSESGIIPEQLLSMDVVQRCRWIVDEFGEMQGLKADFHKVKDALSTFQLPEALSSADLDAKVHWIIKSLNQVQFEYNTMQEEIDRVTNSLSAESRAKDYLQTKLDDLALKYEEISERENELTLERGRVVKMLLEASGIPTDDEGVSQSSYSDAATLFEKFLGNIKEQTGASEGSSSVDAELFEKVVNCLYVRNQELTLCELVLEEEMPIRSQVDSLSNDLRTLSQENESLQKKLERSEEKSKLVRGKLTMAVNKGKGLNQDRENLKKQLDEKSSEIEKISILLQQRESELSDHKDRIIAMSTETERIPNLEMDLASIKQQRDELETFLSESNNVLQRVIGSIDGIVLPVDLVFEDPVEKINWIAEYINECQEANGLLDKQLAGVRDKASALSEKLEEAEAKIRSLEESLSEAEATISRLAEDKTEMEVAKQNVEIELRNVREEASLHSESKRSLEEALSLSENNLKSIIGERESALGGRAAMESELEQVREEVASQTTKLTEAYQTIKSLEEALSSVQSNTNSLAEQNKDSESRRINLETELKKSLEETESQAGKLAIARETIKSLEDALLKVENEVSKLENEKNGAEEEISTLNLKLNAYVEESTGTDRGLENRSAELSGYLFDLQALMNDNTLLSMLKAFEVKFDSLRNMDNILEHIRNDFHGLGLQELQDSHIMEEDLKAAKSISKCLGNIFSLEKFNIDVNVEDGDHISSFGKVVEGFQLRNKAVSEKLDHFSSFVDEFIAALMRKIQATRDEEVIVFQYIDSLKNNVYSLEVYKQEQDGTIVSIENDVTALLSACTMVTGELQFEVKNSLLELGYLPELEQLKIDEVFTQEDHRQSDDSSRYGEAIDMLLLASRKIRASCKQFESTADVAASTIVNLQTSLEEARSAWHKAVEEIDLKQKTISCLEADIEALRNSCTELRLVAEDYQGVQLKLKEREAEVETLANSCSELRALAEEYQANEAQLKDTEAELQALQHSDSNLKLLEANYRAMEVKLHKKEAEVQALKTSCADLKVIAEDYQAMGAKLKEKEADIKAMGAKLKEKEADIKALEISHNKLKGLAEDYQAMEVLLSKKEADVRALQTSCDNFKFIAKDYQALEAKLKEKEAEIEALKTSLGELRLKVKEYQAEEADVKEKEAEVEALQQTCIELRRTIEEYQSKEDRLKERETEVSSLHTSILMREQETEDSLLSPTQVKSLFDKIREIEIHQLESEEAGDSESQNSALVKRLYYIVDNYSLLADDKEELESDFKSQTHEVRLLKEQIENTLRDNDAAEILKKEQSRVMFSLKKISDMLGGSVSSSNSLAGDPNSSGIEGLLSVLEKKVASLLLECEGSKSKAQDLGNKFASSQKFVEELSAKVKLLEDSLQAKSSQSEIRQEKSAYEGPSLPTDPEISEIEDVGKASVSPVPLVAQMRTMRKGSNDHLTIDIDSESSRLINNEETNEDKGHVFKSLNTSGLVPKQGKMVADRLDGMWVSGGRILMNRPRARIAVIAYSLLLHIWLLAAIL